MSKSIEILFEDEYLIIVNKPPGILSQKSLDLKRTTVEDLVKLERPNLPLYLHHRLDKETSGVFLLSCSKEINAALTEMFKSHHFKKTYWCLTHPLPLKLNKNVNYMLKNSFDFPQSEDHWIVKNYMALDKHNSKDRNFGSKNQGKIQRMISVKSGGHPAETEFKILKKFSNYFLVEATPKTGRTHQIRQHLNESQRSLVADLLYGGKELPHFPRFMLHAYELEFEHPKKKELIKIQAPLPNDFKDLLNEH